MDRRICGPVLALGLLLVPGCGSAASTASPTAPSSTTPTTPTPTPTPVNPAITEVRLAGGDYDMGDHFGFVDPSHPSDETPVHKVLVDAFYIADTPTTNGQFLTYLKDALAQRLIEVRGGAVYATGGTDAHENALPMEMTDGERVDSYRRMMSWFSNYLIVDEDSPAGAEAALRARKSFVVFDVLGVPSGFDVSYDEEHWSTTDAALGGELRVTCPTLAADSPTDTTEPAITSAVYKDGAPWKTGCGSWTITEPGVYRVRVDIVPEHLRTALSDQADALIHAYPWLYSQGFRIGL